MKFLSNHRDEKILPTDKKKSLTIAALDGRTIIVNKVQSHITILSAIMKRLIST